MAPVLPLALLAAGVLLATASSSQQPVVRRHVQRRPVRFGGDTKDLSLSPLPYDEHALQPWLSGATVSHHHDEHQKRYVDKANAAMDRLDQLRGDAGQRLSEGELGRQRFEVTNDLVSNASGAMLHEMYWNNLAPVVVPMSPEMARALQRDFGSVDGFMTELEGIGRQITGSGWVILVYSSYLSRLILLAVSKHDRRILPGAVPLLVCDVWEHAYYLDHPADRSSYLDGFWSHVDWSEVERRMASAMSA